MKTEELVERVERLLGRNRRIAVCSSVCWMGFLVAIWFFTKGVIAKAPEIYGIGYGPLTWALVVGGMAGFGIGMILWLLVINAVVIFRGNLIFRALERFVELHRKHETEK